MQKWTLFEAYNDYFSANLMLTKLRSEGFQCTLQNEKTVTVDPLVSNAIGGIKLFVASEESVAVQNWYKVYLNEQLGHQICPRCKQPAVIINPIKNEATSIVSFFKHLFNPSLREFKRYMCNDCYYAFDEVVLSEN